MIVATVKPPDDTPDICHTMYSNTMDMEPLQQLHN